MLTKFLNSRMTEKSAFVQVQSLLTTKDQKKLLVVGVLQTLVSFLDLLGVIIVGGLGALAVQGLESRSAGNKVKFLLNFLGVTNFSLQVQITILGICAALILILKTILSVFFTRWTFFFLSRKSAQVSVGLISKLLRQDLLSIQKRTSQETLYILTEGVQDLMLGVVATWLQVLSDLALLLIMSIGLLVIDPISAATSICLFSIIGYVLHKLLRVRASKLGRDSYAITVGTNQKILEVLNSYRETIVKRRQNFYSAEISKMRYQVSHLTAENMFMPYISKYVIESTTILVTVLLSGYEFASKNAVHALATITVFLAASSRIAPAALRIQQGILTIRRSEGSSAQTAKLIREYESVPSVIESLQSVSFDYPGFEPTVEIDNVEFTYPNTSKKAVSGATFSISSGSSVAIVGPSGAGKTTLVDLILGVLKSDKGTIKISGIDCELALDKWPGSVAYVPQNISVVSGTIRDNVRLGYPLEIASDDHVWKCLERAQLAETFSLSPDGLDTKLGEDGSTLSGGQRQRLGIARSLFTDPRLLILDEATSALDGQTESLVTASINKLKGSVTILIVAHRLSTVKNVDQVVYVDSGKVMAIGTFEDVRNSVPDFDAQAALMGL